MGIFSRLSDIINSNLTSILDKAEDPEKMIRLMIHEMEDTLVEVRSDAARIIADRKEAQRTLGRLEEACAEWRNDTAQSQIKVRKTVSDRRIDDAFARYEKIERRMDGLEGEVEAFDLGKGKTLSEEIAELEAESGIEDELAALKARMSGRKTETSKEREDG